MKPNLPALQLFLYSLGYAMLFAALMYVSYHPPEDGGTSLTTWILTALGTLSGHMLGNKQSRAAHATQTPPSDVQTPAPAGAQAGFISLRLLAVIASIALGLSMLGGCSTVMRGYESAAYNEIKSADDNTLAIWKAMACAMPVGAVLRSPDVIEAVNKLCGGSQAQLGAQQPITINVTVPAAAASAAK